MSKNRSVFYYYKIFYRYLGHQTLLLGALSFVTTLVEGFGIAAFFAYIQDLTSAHPGSSRAVQILFRALEYIHIPQTPIYVCLSMVAIFFVRGALIYISYGYQANLTLKLSLGITQQLVNAFSRMDYKSYTQKNTGYFTQLISKEVDRFVKAFFQISAILPKSISIVTYLALSLRMDWKFTILSIFFGGLIAIIFKSVSYWTSIASREVSASESSLLSIVIQMLQSFKYLYSTSSLPAIRSQVDQHSRKLAHSAAKISHLNAVIPAASEPLIVTFIVLCIYYQTEILRLPLSTLFITMMFLYRVMREVTVVQSSWQSFNSFIGGVDEITDALANLEQSRVEDGNIVIENIQHELVMQNVSFQYKDKPTVKNINLKIPAKSMVAFVGESGSGKSTLVDLITGVLKADSGTISIDKHPYISINKTLFRNKIGYVTQESVMFDDTVANNISLWSHTHDTAGTGRVREALQKANCWNFVEELPHGIDELVGDRGIRLSGGQRQRLSIARELYKNPEILILDEATSALDSESEKLVQESIHRLKGSTTVVLIAHRLSTIRDCDLIFVLRAGQIVESGTFDELNAANGLFKQMCAMQSLT